VTGDDALVAVETQFSEFAGRIWRWTEATSWVEATPGAGGGQPSGLQLRDVAWSSGQFVVVGGRSDLASLGPVVGTSMVSADGQDWQESTPTADLEGVYLVAVAPLPAGGYASLGWVNTRVPDDAVVPLAFTSPDGLTWTAIDDPFDGSGWRPEDLVVTDDGVVAFGSSGADTVAWFTTDGLSWTDAGTLPFTYQDAAALDGEVIAFTADFDTNQGWHLHRGTFGIAD
jgi:hypothetical protein